MFFTPIIFKNPLKKQFFGKKKLYLLHIRIFIRRVWIVIGYFLFEKQAFNELLKVIGI